MPKKLNVGESLAFLIACIDAAGRLDFKRLGDSLEIQPAAARMRLSRLRKAVTNKEFEDAVLVQPGKLDPEIAALANPESRRLTAAASKARQSRIANQERSLTGQSTYLISDEDDYDSEEVLEEEAEASSQQISTAATKRLPKRNATSEPRSENGEGTPLFYEDTPSASRRIKHVKLERNGEEHSGAEGSAEAGAERSFTERLDQHTPAAEIRRGDDEKQESVLRPAKIDQRIPFVPAPVQYQDQRGVLRSRVPRPQPYINPLLDQSAARHQHRSFSPPNSQRLGGRGSEVPNMSRGSSINHGMRPPNDPTSPTPFFGRRQGQPETPADSRYSNPASVFSNFRPARPTPFSEAFPATKRVIVPTHQQPQLPVPKASLYSASHALPNHFFDPGSRDMGSRVRADLETSSPLPKKAAVRAPESNTSGRNSSEIKTEDEGRDAAWDSLASRPPISASRVQTEYGNDATSPVGQASEGRDLDDSEN